LQEFRSSDFKVASAIMGHWFVGSNPCYVTNVLDVLRDQVPEKEPTDPRAEQGSVAHRNSLVEPPDF
jgi:hypothetical protein